jgi:predicted aspartyl protease
LAAFTVCIVAGTGAAQRPAWVAQLGYRADQVYSAKPGRASRPFIEMTIGNVTRRVLFDTGNMAGLSLATNVLDELKLPEVGHWNYSDADGRVVGTYRRVRAPSVTFLGRTLTNQVILEFSDTSVGGLVGPEALPGARFTIDYRAELLAVTDAPLDSVPPGFVVLPLIRSTRQPYLILAMGSINGHPTLFEFDTGATRTNVDPELVRALALPQALNGVRIDSLALGSLMFAIPSARVDGKQGIDPALSPPLLLSVGSDVLSRIIWTVDRAAGRMLIKDARQP